MAKNSIYAPVIWMIEHYASNERDEREIIYGHPGVTDTKGYDLFQPV
jgi:hypothetical protein